MSRFGRKIMRAIHRGLTQDEPVDVSEVDGVRSLFIGSDTIQSSMRVKNPYALELTYSRAMMMFLLFDSQSNPAFREVIILGLGGGSIPKYIHHYLPSMRTRVLEINPKVIQIARSHFYTPENDDRLEIIETDGVAYLADNTTPADILMLDAFDSSGVPPALYSQDFFDTCAENLSMNGILEVNLWGSDKNFDLYLQRIEQGFHQRVLMLPTGRPGNIVVFGFKRMPNELRWSTLRARAKHLQEQHQVEFLTFVEKLKEHNPSSSNRLMLGQD